MQPVQISLDSSTHFASKNGDKTAESTQAEHEGRASAAFRISDYLCRERPFLLSNMPYITGIESEASLHQAAAKIFSDVLEPRFQTNNNYDSSTKNQNWELGCSFEKFTNVFEQAEQRGLYHLRLTPRPQKSFEEIHATTPKIVSCVGQLKHFSYFIREINQKRRREMMPASVDETNDPQASTNYVSEIEEASQKMKEAAELLCHFYIEVACAGANLFTHARAKAQFNNDGALKSVRETKAFVDFDPLNPQIRDFMTELVSINNLLIEQGFAVAQPQQKPLEQYWDDWKNGMPFEHQKKWELTLAWTHGED